MTGENYDDPDNKSATLSLKSIYLLFKERCILTRKHLKALTGKVLEGNSVGEGE